VIITKVQGDVAHIRDQMNEDVAPSLPPIFDMLLQSVIALFALLPFVASAPQVSDPAP
jgi:hypothetical protein